MNFSVLFYGKFEEMQDYKEMLKQKKILIPPYDDAIYKISD